MRNKTQSKGMRRSVRIGTAGLVSAIAVLGGTLGIAATPAFANAVLQPGIISSLQVGTAYDFSYTANGQQMARNIDLQAGWFAPNTTVHFSWRDATNGGPWVAGPSSTATVPSSLASYYAITNVVPVTAIPSSACGHTLQIEGQGKTGTYNGLDYTTANYSALYPATASATIIDDCGPKVWLTATGIAGDGFTPGGPASIMTFGRSTSANQMGPMLTWQSTPATKQTNGLRCFRRNVGFSCVVVVLVPGGLVNITNPLTTSDSFCSGETYEGYDPSTNLSDTESVICLG